MTIAHVTPRRSGAALLSLVALVCIALAGLAPPARAFEPYKLAPPPPPRTAHERLLLRGTGFVVRDGWMEIHLHGSPYRVGFQNGYLASQSAHYFLHMALGTAGNAYRRESATIARRCVWPLIPRQYRRELRGIADGLHAAGYRRDSLWDVVAANDWADQGCYAKLLGKTAAVAASRRAAATGVPARQGGCSAFIATGAATVDGRPVMGHNTWSAYDQNFMGNIMFYVHPDRGLDFCYQAAGGLIWSGSDWYENSAGLMLCETTLVDTAWDPTGRPVFVRARLAAQYASTVKQAVRILRKRNNGAYANEWLIGDASGTIASLQLSSRASDLNVTRSGFFGSSNYAWGPKTRDDEGSWADPPDPANVDYARYVRWGQLEAQYSGAIDITVAQTMVADTVDTYLATERPDMRTICGESEHGRSGVPYSGHSDFGAYDGKVCTEEMVLNGMRMMARWGHPNGDDFSARKFLSSNPRWASRCGPFAVFGLRTFSAQTPNPWVLLGGS